MYYEGWLNVRRSRVIDKFVHIPRLNVPLLLKVMDHIEAHPEEHDQVTWAVRRTKRDDTCGTAYCFAGHTVNMTMAADERFDFVQETSRVEIASVVAGPNTRSSISSRATHELGITEVEASVLFYPRNTREQLRELTGELIEAEQIRLRKAV